MRPGCLDAPTDLTIQTLRESKEFREVKQAIAAVDGEKGKLWPDHTRSYDHIWLTARRFTLVPTGHPRGLRDSLRMRLNGHGRASSRIAAGPFRRKFGAIVARTKRNPGFKTKEEGICNL